MTANTKKFSTKDRKHVTTKAQPQNGSFKSVVAVLSLEININETFIAQDCLQASLFTSIFLLSACNASSYEGCSANAGAISIAEDCIRSDGISTRAALIRRYRCFANQELTKKSKIGFPLFIQRLFHTISPATFEL